MIARINDAPEAMDESNYMFVDLLKPMSHMDSEAGSSLCWIWSDAWCSSFTIFFARFSRQL